MSQNESAAHLELKRLCLLWARSQGYRIAATEVSLPQYRFRLDVAAYRPGRESFHAPERKNGTASRASLGYSAAFECKASRLDYRRDAASRSVLEEKIQKLHHRRLELERLLNLYYPSILNGDSLFQEYQTVDYTRPGHSEYGETLKEIGQLNGQLIANTKFDKLIRWGAANLFYVVAEPDAVQPHELPPGWGLLLRKQDQLEVITKPIFQTIAESERLSLLHRIAITATRSASKNLISKTPPPPR